MKKYFIALTLSFLMAHTALAQDISDKIRQVQGVDTVTEVASNRPGYRVFEVQFLQEEDHFTANSPTFRQKLVVWHKNENRPMVLQTSGYAIFGNSLAALATEFDANQIQVEHRFFANSTPASQNWSLDNIKQSAADFHKITENFKSIYAAKWVNTGRSKGGMTSLYHHYFYPDDLAATVAHVAPHSYSLEDQRYADFVANKIGGPENGTVCHTKCRATTRIRSKISRYV
jgi:hypothetical protein